jgi:hypothetical protein
MAFPALFSWVNALIAFLKTVSLFGHTLITMDAQNRSI